jgi:hypothetical protein
MKKYFKISLAAAFLVGMTLTSCSNEPKLMTEAELSKKVSEATEMKTKSLEGQLDEECSANMDAKVKAAVETMVAAKKAEMSATK